jgi:UDP-N-acetylglucosamine 4,6-dehydratase
MPPQGGEAVSEGFSYRSDGNDMWLTADDLRALMASCA